MLAPFTLSLRCATLIRFSQVAFVLVVEAKGLEPSNLLTASQALYQLSYAPEDASTLSDLADAGLPAGFRIPGHVGRRESLALTVRIG